MNAVLRTKNSEADAFYHFLVQAPHAVNEQLVMYKHFQAIRIKIFLCRYASGQVECCERRNPLNVAILTDCYVSNDFNSGIAGL